MMMVTMIMVWLLMLRFVFLLDWNYCMMFVMDRFGLDWWSEVGAGVLIIRLRFMIAFMRRRIGFIIVQMWLFMIVFLRWCIGFRFMIIVMNRFMVLLVWR